MLSHVRKISGGNFTRTWRKVIMLLILTRANKSSRTKSYNKSKQQYKLNLKKLIILIRRKRNNNNKKIKLLFASAKLEFYPRVR